MRRLDFEFLGTWITFDNLHPKKQNYKKKSKYNKWQKKSGKFSREWIKDKVYEETKKNFFY
jgi:hypothetical protein